MFIIYYLKVQEQLNESVKKSKKKKAAKCDESFIIHELVLFFKYFATYNIV